MSRTAVIGALAVSLFLGFAAYRMDALIKERNELRLDVASQQAVIESLQNTQQVTEVVLSDRVRSKAAIQERAKDVQVEIQKRLGGEPVCALPPDWRLLHDAAASDSRLPEAPSGADATAVTPQEAASTVADNYATYHDTADQLRKLQQWIQGVSNAD